MMLPLDGEKKFDDIYNLSAQYQHSTDGQTDRQTDGRTEMVNQYRALHADVRRKCPVTGTKPE